MTKSFAALAFPLALLAVSVAPAHAADNTPNPMLMDQPQTPPPASIGQTELEQVLTLEGTWDAQTKLGVLTDTFQSFAYGTAVLGQELLNGKQITATIFYVVNGELRADHYCDFLNQPRYTVQPSLDPATLEFEFRGADNLDTHPMHFHSTKWKLVDADHMIQDWYIMGGKKPVSLAHMEFVKRAPGAPLPAPTAMVK